MATELTTAQAFRSALTKMEPEYARALPEHIKPERFVRVVQTAVTSNPGLLNADRSSLWSATTKCAQDGLLPDGREAALVTFGKTVQYMPMIAGILKKVRNSGELLSITAEVVKDTDQFERWLDDEGDHFTHRPNYDEDGKPRLVYAFAKTKDGGRYLDVMSVADVERVRSVSRAKDSGPWVSFWGEMAKKTVLRRLSKRLPMSTDLDEFMRRDDDLADFSESAPAERDVTPPTRPRGLDTVAAAAVDEEIPGDVIEPKEGDVF